MNALGHRLEANPILGYVSSFFSVLLGWLSWTIQHADDFSKVFGFAATLLGFLAGYYTFRVQRRTWKRLSAADERAHKDQGKDSDCRRFSLWNMVKKMLKRWRSGGPKVRS